MNSTISDYEEFSEIYQLVFDSLSGEITPEGVARLDELVCNDPRACRLYVQLIQESADLRIWASARKETADQTPIHYKPKRSLTAWWTSIVAAASLIACLLAARIYYSSPEQGPQALSSQQLELETKAVMVEAQSVLTLLDELEQENDTIVLLIGQEADSDGGKSSEEKEAS